MHRTIIATLLLLCLLASTARAAVPPSLTLFSVNDRGVADLLPGARVLIVAELRSTDDRPYATLTAPAPDGLELESFRISSGTANRFLSLGPDIGPFLLWTGAVSPAAPINISMVYRVLSTAAPGDRVVTVYGQTGTQSQAVPLAATTVIRICCIAASPLASTTFRVYLPAFR